MTKLERLRELLEKASGGTWYARHYEVCGKECTDYDVGECGTREDAALIAEMRNALPDLLRVVEAIDKYEREWAADLAEQDIDLHPKEWIAVVNALKAFR